MKPKLILFIGLSAIIASFFIIYYIMKISYENRNIELKEAIRGQQKSNEANFDKMFKTIAQVAQVSEKYRETFSKVYPEIISGRYSDKDGGSLMKFVTESNPNFDTKLYDKLISAIESNREDFFKEQQKLIDMNREHRTFIAKFPQNHLIKQSDTIGIVVVTSTNTQKTFSSGKEDDIKI